MSETDERFVPADICEDLLCCVICYESFTEERIPKALPCLHTFCRGCLAGSIEAYRKTVKSLRKDSPAYRHFPCPVCKEYTRVPEKGVDGFKDDFRIRRISEAMNRPKPIKQSSIVRSSSEESNSSGSEDGKDSPKCDICKFFDKDNQAIVYCLECGKGMCNACGEQHVNAGITKDHQVIDITKHHFPVEAVCKEHSGETLRYYCVTCSQPTCMACTYAASHKGHELGKLNDYTVNCKKNLNKLLGKIKGVIDTSAIFHSDFVEVEDALKIKEKSAQKAILLRTLEDISKIKSKQAKMEKELEKICQEKKKDIESSKDKVAEAREYIKFVETMLEKGQDLHLACMEHSIEKRLHALEKDARSTSDQVESFTNLGLYEGLASDDLEITTKSDNVAKSSILSEIKSVVSQMRLFSSGEHPERPQNLKLIARVGKKGSANGEFNFPSGVDVLPNGDIVVADLHNNRIQVLSPEGKFKHKFGHEGFKPCGVAVTPNGDIAVVDCAQHSNRIKIFSSTGTRKRSFGYGEFSYPFSLVIDSKGRYIVSDPAVNKVTILNPDGSLYNRFETKSKYCFYVTVDNNDNIVLSDWFNHCVKIFDRDGRLLKKLGSSGANDGELMIPLGVCVDKSDNILVLDCRCGRVSLFNSNGEFVKHVIGRGDGIEHSRAMALSKTGRLIITSGDKKKEIPNEIRVFQI